jgi:hypothetical protein
MKLPMGKSSSKPAAKIRVSQATIDKIKTMGMTKALAGTKSANPEMKEALTRMYGARRVSAAAAKMAPKPVPRGAKVDMGKVAPKMPGKGPAVKVAAAAKKKTTTDPFAKFVFGVGKAAAEPFKSKPKPQK